MVAPACLERRNHGVVNEIQCQRHGVTETQTAGEDAGTKATALRRQLLKGLK